MSTPGETAGARPEAGVDNPDVLKLPEVDKMSPDVVAQFFVEMESYPDAQAMMDQYELSELEGILAALIAHGKKELGDSFEFADVEFADGDDNDAKEKKVSDRTRQALTLLKATVGASVDSPAPEGDGHDHAGDSDPDALGDADTGSDTDEDEPDLADAVEAGKDALDSAEDAKDGIFAGVQDIIDNEKGTTWDKLAKATDLVGNYGQDALDSAESAMDAARQAMVDNQDKGPLAAAFAAISAFMKSFSLSMDKKTESRKKKREMEKAKKGDEKASESIESLKGFTPICEAFGIKGMRVTSPWGPRPTPDGLMKKGEPRTQEWHNGVDFSANAGDEIRAFQDCSIKKRGNHSITLKDSAGREYILNHVDVSSLDSDGWIKKKRGEVIVKIGQEDSASDGTHLDVRRADGENPLKDGYFAAAVLGQNASYASKNKGRIDELTAKGAGKLTTRLHHRNDAAYFEKFGGEFGYDSPPSTT